MVSEELRQKIKQIAELRSEINAIYLYSAYFDSEFATLSSACFEASVIMLLFLSTWAAKYATSSKD